MFIYCMDAEKQNLDDACAQYRCSSACRFCSYTEGMYPIQGSVSDSVKYWTFWRGSVSAQLQDMNQSAPCKVTSQASSFLNRMVLGKGQRKRTFPVMRQTWWSRLYTCFKLQHRQCMRRIPQHNYLIAAADGPVRLPEQACRDSSLN